MIRYRHLMALALLAVTGIAGTHLLTAQEPLIRQSRATPRQIHDAAAERPILTATAPHTVGHSVRDLRVLADDMEKAGRPLEAARLRTIIEEIVRRVERDVSDKKSLVTQLNEEIEDLKLVIGKPAASR